MAKTKKTATKKTSKPKSAIRPVVAPDASDAMPQFGAPGAVIGEPEMVEPVQVTTTPEVPVEEVTPVTPTPATTEKTRGRKPRATKGIPEIADVQTIEDLGLAFLAALPRRGKSLGTARSYDADLAVARKYFGKDRDIHTLTMNEVTAYFESDAVLKLRDGTPKNAVTTAKIRRVFRQALLWAEEVRILNVAPLPTKGTAA